jgi:hypothetical protein
LVAAGCGAAARPVPLRTYRPPLREIQFASAAQPRASRVVKRMLQVIASTMSPPRFSGRDPISFSDFRYELIISDAGSSNAFTSAQTVGEEVTVSPNSSAEISERVLTSPRFLSRVDQLHWEAGGKRPYSSPADRAGASSGSKAPAGMFSFTPQGGAVTFQQARTLPAEPRALSTELRRLAGARSAPPGALTLRQYGFLLATAPLSGPARRAILKAVGSLHGIHLCDALFPTRKFRDKAFCVNGDPTSTEILLNPETGVVDLVCERLDDATALYPNMGVGTLVDSDTFVLRSSAS